MVPSRKQALPVTMRSGFEGFVSTYGEEAVMAPRHRESLHMFNLDLARQFADVLSGRAHRSPHPSSPRLRSKKWSDGCGLFESVSSKNWPRGRSSDFQKGDDIMKRIIGWARLAAGLRQPRLGKRDHAADCTAISSKGPGVACPPPFNASAVSIDQLLNARKTLGDFISP